MKRKNAFKPKQKKATLHYGDRVKTDKGEGTIVKFFPFDLVDVKLDSGEIYNTFRDEVKVVKRK